MKRRGVQHRTGATMVETAIVLPVFLLLIAGIVDLGLGVLRYTETALAAREVVRQASVHGSAAPPKRAAWGPTAQSFDTRNRSASPQREPAEQTSSNEGAAGGATDMLDELKPHLHGLDRYDTTVELEWPDGDNHWGSQVRATIKTVYHPLLLGKQPLTLSASCSSTISH